MSASFSVQSGDTNVKVYAAVFAKDSNGDNTAVTLDQGDSFVASTDAGGPVTLVHEDSDDAGHYSATLPLATAAENVTIALVRGNGQVSAPNSVIPLAAPFAMTSTSPTTVKRGDSIPFNLAPVPSLASSAIKFEALGPCVDDKSTTLATPAVDDQGDGAIDTTKITFKDASTCDVDFYVDALASGTLDPAYAGGFGDGATSAQRRAITRSITP